MSSPVTSVFISIEAREVRLTIRTVRSLGNIGAQNASSLGAGEDAGVGGLRDVSQVGVVVGVQGRLEGASLVEVGIFPNIRSCIILLQ